MALLARQTSATPSTPNAPVAQVPAVPFQQPTQSPIWGFGYPEQPPQKFSVYVLPSQTIFFGASVQTTMISWVGETSFEGIPIEIKAGFQKIVIGRPPGITMERELYASTPTQISQINTANSPQTTVASVSNAASNSSPSITVGQPPPVNPSNLTVNSPLKNAGLPVGAIAGIAVGCLLVGALIAAFLLWLLCGRPHKGRLARDSEVSSVALIRNEKGPITQALSLASGSPISHSLENGLPQPLEDKAITGEISKISNSIKNHVQSFYHSGRVSPGLLDLDDLQALGSDLPVSTGTLSTLLGNFNTREIALRFCIAWVVISRMRPQTNQDITLLPPEIVTCFQSMPVQASASRAQAKFLAKWRVITTELMQSTYGRSTFTVTDPRSYNIDKAANTLDGVLRLYSDSRIDNSQRRRNLEEIIKRAANFAFTLFSQAGSWDYDWQDDDGVQSGNLCIFPALVQNLDDLGEPIQPPRAFSDPIVRRLDG